MVKIKRKTKTGNKKTKKNKAIDTLEPASVDYSDDLLAEDIESLNQSGNDHFDISSSVNDLLEKSVVDNGYPTSNASDEQNNSNSDNSEPDNAESGSESDNAASGSESDNAESGSESEHSAKKPKLLGKKTREQLKRKITEWLDNDDKIKELNTKVKRYKDAKKQSEEVIMKMINVLGMEESKIDVHDDNKQLRSRVYRYKSTTRGALKEETIKNALMEVIRDEKRVEQLVKKIESKRPINERFYLKRTKGNKD